MTGLLPIPPANIVVEWSNPVTGTGDRRTFDTYKDAEDYIEGRVRKYGNFKGFAKPRVITPPEKDV